jgi:hypothetical protein
MTSGIKSILHAEDGIFGVSDFGFVSLDLQQIAVKNDCALHLPDGSRCVERAFEKKVIATYQAKIERFLCSDRFLTFKISSSVHSLPMQSSRSPLSPQIGSRRGFISNASCHSSEKRAHTEADAIHPAKTATGACLADAPAQRSLAPKLTQAARTEFAPTAGHRRRALPEARRFQISLRSRCTAMLAGLRTLIQTPHGPH